VRIACLEEISLMKGYIDADQAYALGAAQAKSAYGTYVMEVARAARG
jgi:glucose-1-phosphate thymidylyltransferase